jgi:sec-independent protein translocase protein TatB
MFDVGFWELVLIFALGLLVLGPEKLPKVAAQLGNWAGQARRMARILTTQLREEIEKEAQRQEPDPRPPPAYSRPGLDELRANAPHAEESSAADSQSASPPPGAGGPPH